MQPFENSKCSVCVYKKQCGKELVSDLAKNISFFGSEGRPGRTDRAREGLVDRPDGHHGKFQPKVRICIRNPRAGAL
jgi:hypothetical protein